LIVYGSASTQESLLYGKQLLDTFKPKIILAEDGPFEMKTELKDKGYKAFVEQFIVQNEQAYKVGDDGMVQKKYPDGQLELSDMPTFVLYHMR